MTERQIGILISAAVVCRIVVFDNTVQYSFQYGLAG